MRRAVRHAALRLRLRHDGLRGCGSAGEAGRWSARREGSQTEEGRQEGCKDVQACHLHQRRGAQQEGREGRDSCGGRHTNAERAEAVEEASRRRCCRRRRRCRSRWRSREGGRQKAEPKAARGWGVGGDERADSFRGQSAGRRRFAPEEAAPPLCTAAGSESERARGGAPPGGLARRASDLGCSPPLGASRRSATAAPRPRRPRGGSRCAFATHRRSSAQSPRCASARRRRPTRACRRRRR